MQGIGRGRLNSGIGFLSGRAQPISHLCTSCCELCAEQFRLHKELENREPTIFISTTQYLLYALKIGIEKWLDSKLPYQGMKGESSEGSIFPDCEHSLSA
jgi:hypothetical protein